MFIPKTTTGKYFLEFHQNESFSCQNNELIDGLEYLIYNTEINDIIKIVYNLSGENDGFEDKNLFCFWSYERIESVRTFRKGKYFLPKLERYFLFLDYVHCSWYYAFDYKTGEIILLGTEDNTPKYIASSMLEFIKLYISDADEIYANG